jgi:M6 family metalloprotease-like protein
MSRGSAIKFYIVLDIKTYFIKVSTITIKGAIMQRLIFTTMVILTIFSAYLQAAWLDDIPRMVSQPDGTLIDLFVSGDEFHSWAHDAAGFTIVKDPSTGFYCWAMSQDGDLVSTGYPIHIHTPQSLNLRPRENISRERYMEYRAMWDSHSRGFDTRTPTTGVINNIVVFIRFADQVEFTETTDYYEHIYNSTIPGDNSLYRYFYDASYQQLEIVSHFYPLTSGSTVVSYQSPNPRDYYMPYCATTNPIGYQGGHLGQERTDREHQLLAAAINAIAHQIPPSLVIDSTGDGFVDNVIFMIRGDSGEWSSLIWPHKWALFSVHAFINGKRVWNYNLNSEEYFYHQTAGGTALLVHEFGHSLGAPDYYRYWEQFIVPTGIWEVMSNQTNPPQSMTAHTKWKYMGWIPQIPLLTTGGIYTLSPVSTHASSQAYRIASPYIYNEYFVVEYRSRTASLTDSTLPGSGLIVYRIQSGIDGNSEGPPDELYVFRPGGTLHVNGEIRQAFFSAQANRTTMHDQTNPFSFLSNGMEGGLFLTHIGHADSTISFAYVDIWASRQFSITPTSHGFSTEPSSQTFTIINTGGEQLRINSISLSGVDADQYSIDNQNALPMDMNSGDIRTFDVVFSPTSVGTKTANLTISHNASGSPWTTIILGGLLSDSDIVIPHQRTELKGNYPNPFNPETSIKYMTHRYEHVLIEVYNVRGQKVATLVDDYKSAGTHTTIWDGTDSMSRSVASGIYFYTMTTGDYHKVKKMVLLK